jgi:hypothetical protein
MNIYSKGLALFLITFIIVTLFAWDYLMQKNNSFEILFKKKNFLSKYVPKSSLKLRWILTLLAFICCIIYLIVDLDDYKNLYSLQGIVFLVVLAILISTHPSFVSFNRAYFFILLKEKI